MTTPASAANPISVSVATDKQTYNVGEAITVTVTYTDSNVVTKPLTVTVQVGPDAAGNTATGTAEVQVVQGTPQELAVAVSDSFGNAYTQTAASAGSAVHASTVGNPPAAA